ncbi:MAG: hypothetical protein ACI89A_000065 [Porticoccaceae bacterium]|jgi:hypothetical protein
MEKGDRGYYLKTLGIDEYLARDLSKDSEIPEVEAFETPPIKTLVDRIPKQASAEQVIGSFGTSIDPVAEFPQTKAEPLSAVVDSLGKKSDPIVNIELQLALWQPTDELLVCSVVDRSLPDPNQIQLLSNILVAMGQGQGNLPQMELAEWPPYPNAAGAESEVREFLTMVIQARLDAKKSKMMLMLGMKTASWILTGEQLSKITNGHIDVFNEIIGLVVPSLGEMIEDPQSKRKTWNTIKFLSPAIKLNQPNNGD